MPLHGLHRSALESVSGEIARLARERGVLVHTDAAQSVGKVPVDVGRLGVDFPTLAGHKLYAPKGVGALYMRSGVELPRLLHGAVRFSVGRGTSEREIDEAVRVVAEAVRRLGPGAAPSAVETGDGEVKLTRFTHGMGCACKLRPQDLEQVLRKLPKVTDPAALVGPESSDDAAVYRLGPDLAVVSTVDFFTPIADDPFDFGAISAANSLSDVYAMGAKPFFALSVVGFPSRRLPLRVLERILEGAAEVAAEAGIAILGGHTVDDTEPKFGLAVTGVVHPERVVTNAAARPGDALVLTKPIGTGILATAVKRGLTDEAVARRLVATMRRLNKAAAEAIEETGAHACTDVTGFGLLGHLREMAAASGVDAEVDAGAVPVLEPAREMAAADVVPGGTLDNLAHVGPFVDFAPGLSRVDRVLLADAQTSGGLLIAPPPERTEALLLALAGRGVSDARWIGRFTKAGKGCIRVL
jgi:selenium donor protein